MLFSLLLASMLAAVPPGFDLNSASYEELLNLEGLTSEQVVVLYEYIQGTGGLENIYEVLELPEFTPVTLGWLRENAIVLPAPEPEISSNILNVMERLAQEDGWLPGHL